MPFTREQKEEFRVIIKEVMTQIFSDKEYISDILKNIYGPVEKRVGEMEEKLSTLEKEIDHCNVKKRLRTVENTIITLEKENVALKIKMDTLEQYSRKNNIIINGINEEKNEDICFKVASLVREKLQVNINQGDISACHRVGNKNTNTSGRPVIVKFTNLSIKHNILKNRKFLKNTTVFVAEDLTRQRYRLYTDCRNKLGNRNVWISNGKITVKIADGKDKFRRLVLEKFEDLSGLEDMMVK